MLEAEDFYSHYICVITLDTTKTVFAGRNLEQNWTQWSLILNWEAWIRVLTRHLMAAVLFNSSQKVKDIQIQKTESHHPHQLMNTCK